MDEASLYDDSHDSVEASQLDSDTQPLEEPYELSLVVLEVVLDEKK